MVPLDPLGAPLRVALLGLDEGGVYVEGVRLDVIPPQEAGAEGVPHLAEPLQPGLARLRIAHPAEPVPHRVGIRERVLAEQREEGLLTLEVPQVLQGPPAGVEQQDDRLDDDRGRSLGGSLSLGGTALRGPAGPARGCTPPAAPGPHGPSGFRPSVRA